MKHSNAVLPTCMVSVVERINWPSERLKIRTHRTFKTMSNMRTNASVLRIETKSLRPFRENTNPKNVPGILFTFCFYDSNLHRNLRCFYLLGLHFELVLYRFSVIASLFIDRLLHKCVFVYRSNITDSVCERLNSNSNRFWYFHETALTLMPHSLLSTPISSREMDLARF